MRFLLFLLLTLGLSQALELSKLKVTPSLKKLEITLPLQEKFQTSSKDNQLILTFSSPLVGEPLTQELKAPFEKIIISNNPQNKAQITLYGKNLELSTQKNQDEMVLSFTSEIIQISWGTYFSVIGFLFFTALILLLVKKRLKPIAHKSHYQETFLNAKTKLITLEYEGEKYLIFSNQNGCVLLNHYPKTKDNKEFTDLIKEE